MVVKTKYNDDDSFQGVDESLKSLGGRHKLKNAEQMKDINSIYDTDIRNAELLIDKHSEDPFGVMRIQEYDCVPMAKETDDVVIRVEVSNIVSFFVSLISFHILIVMCISTSLRHQLSAMSIVRLEMEVLSGNLDKNRHFHLSLG
jgi:hypothetical protein